ncbi:glutamine ABC transporter substrate-binding protein [Actibacterium mucosum KCTC 23349]|uniref:Glutamine ABC transporter substrate-binding protein n=2 Tax=Actibacterium TaxID=1433986 RepID=A0A037ZLY0_9RHOB|nr:transporter substrate-binding domain-containing protein [Actibacterium mucosum]KAJ57411.1 glutamine ABC transporter substrate-binding protein [Actibacterium mucosum KCTC 23349]
MGIFAVAIAVLFANAIAALAQSVTVATVDRPPFSFEQEGQRTGFSIELWQAVARDLGLTVTFENKGGFASMLGSVEANEVDAAAANISITATREEVLDFSHTIFESGLQIMVPKDSLSDTSGLLLSALLSRDLLISIGIAFLLLFGGGMLMWVFERNKQPYFDRGASEAMFPSFWWALNLVVNGGFEERVPRSFFGRIFAVILVLSSLFIVSVFVAKITAVITVDAIQGSVNSVNDLHGKRVATIESSTTARFLDDRNIEYASYPSLDTLIEAFESDTLDAVVFDAPILAYYVNTRGNEGAALAGATFRRESYGFALPAGSPLLESINQSLLRQRENGTYERLYRKYFGAID